MNKFWNWIRDDTTGGRVLHLEGPIDEDLFWGDEITPQAFRDELNAEDGDVLVWINSPGGNVFAAAEIYTMLKDYPGAVTVRIASIAASAASVVAMAGERVEMSPTALLMIHDPSTIAMGNTKDMERAITTLNEVKESIINAYAAKTGLRHNRIAELMSNETWMNAKKAVDLGFADEVLFEDKKAEEKEDPKEDEGEDTEDKAPVKLYLKPLLFSSRKTELAVLNRIKAELTEPEPPEPEPVPTDLKPKIGLDGRTEDGAMPYTILSRQLDFLK